MREIVRSRKFDKEYKNVGGLTAELIDVMYHLIHDKPLPEKYKNHPLKGEWRGFWDCHVKPDLVLIYRITNETI